MENTRTDFATMVGLIMGSAIIILGIVTGGGELYWFWNLNSLLIVIGGTFAATMVNLPMKAVTNTFSIVKNVFQGEDYDYSGVIEEVVQKATKARKDGLLSLEAGLNDIDSVFLRNGVELAINERDSNRLRTFLTMDLNNISTRHIGAQEIILYMAAYAPAFGMLGTVLGLIIMMNKFQMSGETSSIDFNVADQFSALLVGMGTALITTFYGVFLANMVFLPIAGKLKRRSENEIMLKSIVLEGIISIHGREHPILIKEKLMTFVAMSERNALEEKEK